MRYLTKSRFKLAVECPTKLFYAGPGKASIYRNLLSEDSFMQALAEGGFQVGKVATMRYPQGIEVTERGNAQALARTQELLSTHTDIVLFEPAIAHAGLLVRVDILVKQGSALQLIEVKAKSYNSAEPEILGARGGITSDMLPYIQDVAFQKYVVSQAMPQARIQCFLMMPNKAVAATVNGLNQCFKVIRHEKSTKVLTLPQTQALVDASPDLLALVSVDAYIDMVMAAPLSSPGGQGGPQDFLPQVVARWAQAYEADEKIPPTIHKGCAHCEFREPAIGQVGGSDAPGRMRSGYHECLQQAAGLSIEEVEAGTVLDIWNFRGKDKLIDQGVLRMGQVHEEDLKVKSDKSGGLSNSERQWMQVGGMPPESKAQGFYFNREYFEEARSKWRWPFHMIDFETSTVALPFFKGMRPYESVAFQFSHHVMHEDGRIEHQTQALFATPGDFPNLKFVRALHQALGQDNGTIFRWAAHENTILRHIKDQLLSPNAAQLLGAQDLSDRDVLVAFIDDVVSYTVGDVLIAGPRAMVDLNHMARRAYFHPSTKGRTSIKKVLPAVMASSQLLRQKYAQPIYGQQIPSLNFQQGLAWIEEVAGGTGGAALRDPYERLKTLATEMLGKEPAPDDVEVAEGGAAAMAYARLQFEDLSAAQRTQIEQALLRYCELDTFAMVMILEAWLEWGRG
jgi:hypothetical protein